MGRGPTRIASPTWVRVACRRLGTTYRWLRSPPDPEASWHWAQFIMNSAFPSDKVGQVGDSLLQAGVMSGMPGPGVPCSMSRALTYATMSAICALLKKGALL